YIKVFNLFQSYPPPTNPVHIHNELISTRLYITTLLISSLILGFYTSFIDRTQIVTTKSPTIEQYNRIYEQHYQTLTCPCTKVSISYETFIRLSPTYHQICTSRFISEEWYWYLLANGDFIQQNDDFRKTSLGSFQMLSTFCQSVSQTVNDSLSVFYSSNYVTGKLISQQLFEVQSNSFIDLFILDATNSYKHALQIIRDTTQGNALLAAESELFFSYNYYSIIKSPDIYYDSNNQSCSCTSTDKCIAESKIYEIANWDDTDYVYELSGNYFNVTGFYYGCYIIESLLQSTLECFYNETCFTQINSMILVPLSTTNMNVTALNVSVKSQYKPETTIETIVNNLMIEQWNPSISFGSYYNECQPSECTYTYTAKLDIVYVLTTIIGLTGGLTKVLPLIIPNLVAAMTLYVIPYIRKYFEKKRRNRAASATTSDKPNNVSL
ncbi:unnamed protein product, partial [Didymodactylos carnosus]